MLRKLIRWVRHPGDEWETVMRNMKVRMNKAMDQLYIKPWDARIASSREANFKRIQSMTDERWEKLSIQWDPTVVDDEFQEFAPHRRPGRPLLRWTDPVVGDVVVID